MGKKEKEKRVGIFSVVDSLEAFKAAVSAGSDSASFDLMDMKGEESYGLSQIEYAVAYAGAFGSQVYASIDFLVKNSEVGRILEMVHQAASAGVDGFIIFDPAIAGIIKKEMPGTEVILSDKNTVTNSMAALLHQSADGFIVPKELSREDVIQMRKRYPGKIHMNVYSEQCFSYAGKCYLGSLLFQKSANRNKCRKLCKKAFRKGSSLAQRDLLLIHQMPDLISMGIDSLSLRLLSKEPQFVHSLVGIFRKALDSFYEGAFQVEDIEKLYLLLEGSATEGHFGRWRDPFLSYRKGIPLGVVENNEIQLESSLKKGDIVKLIRGDSERLSRISYLLNRGNRVESAQKGEKVSMQFSNFRNGCSLYKVASKYVDVSYPRIPITAKAALVKGKEPRLTLRCRDMEIEVKGKKSVEEASKTPLDSEIVRQNLSRLSSTPFYMDSVEIDIEEGAIVQYSELNRLKRDALKVLLERFLKRKEFPAIGHAMPAAASSKSPAEIYVYAYDMEGVMDAHKAGADLIYYDIFASDVSEVLDYGKKNKLPIYLATPAAVHESGMQHIVKLIEHYSPQGILVEDAGLLSDKIKAKKHIFHSLNISNDLGMQYWKHDAVISIELNMSELLGFKDRGFILFAHGSMRLLLSKKESRHPELSLKTGRRLDAIRNPYGQTLVIDPQRIMLLDHIGRLYKAGIRRFFLDITDDVEETVRAYREALEGKTADIVTSGTTLGHLNRGI